MTVTIPEDDFTEVSGSSWVKFEKPGDTARGVFLERFSKEATEVFDKQIVATLGFATFNGVEQGSINVALKANNPYYSTAIKNLIPGHQVIITLDGFYNQDEGKIVATTSTTKKGINFSKSFTIKQHHSVDPRYSADTSLDGFEDVSDADLA